MVSPNNTCPGLSGTAARCLYRHLFSPFVGFIKKLQEVIDRLPRALISMVFTIITPASQPAVDMLI
uniref:Uncharacterized protein n=1 Tax=viral metagenome TaxID=1070528 RepID=A0A6M3JW97_9ZZZZ